MTRREWLAAAGMALTGACGPKKRAGYRGYALIATAGDDSVSVVDLTAFQLVKTVRLNAPPSSVVAGALPGRNFVLTPSNGSVHVIDEKLNVVASRRLADGLSEIRLAPDGERLIAIAPHSRDLLEIEPSNLAVVHRHRLSAEPAALEVSKNGYAAVSTGNHGTVELVDLARRQHCQTQLQSQLGQVRFRADGKLLLAANLGDSSLVALNVPALQVIAELTLAMKPENLCFNSDQGQLFVSGAGMDAVAIVFPYRILEVDQTILAGRTPGVMASSASPPYLFVGSNGGSDVCILNIDSRKVIGLVEVGQKPGYIAITPDNQYALVLDEASGDMAVVHIPAVRANRSKSGGLPAWASVSTPLFTMLSVGSQPVQAAIVPLSA